MARPIAREAAMQLVFEQLFGGDATAETLVDLIDYVPSEKDGEYINTVVAGVKEHGRWRVCPASIWQSCVWQFLRCSIPVCLPLSPSMKLSN